MNNDMHEGIDEAKEDNIGEDSPVTIHQMENGFLVRPFVAPQEFGMAIDHKQEYVFQTFSELQQFLERHFSHRESNIKAD